MDFTPTDNSLFFTRNDRQDPRLGDLVKVPPSPASPAELQATLEEMAQTLLPDRPSVLAGYPDDEGIRLNGGRPGAALAPEQVRRPLYKMTPQLNAARSDFTLLDIGNLKIENRTLADRHETAKAYALASLQAGARWISVGGGHDYGFPDASAFATWCESQGIRPLVLNFDAHLDVRPFDMGFSSGTPFCRLLTTHPELDFAEIGIQGHCNSREHLQWARSKGARILTMEELEASGEPPVTLVTRMLGDWITRPRAVFLSIDIDGFSSAVAPGCSQSWATGFTSQDFFSVLQLLCRRLDVRGLGIYEVSPPLDHDNRTAKLAAQIIHRVLNPY